MVVGRRLPNAPCLVAQAHFVRGGRFSCTSDVITLNEIRRHAKLGYTTRMRTNGRTSRTRRCLLGPTITLRRFCASFIILLPQTAVHPEHRLLALRKAVTLGKAIVLILIIRIEPRLQRSGWHSGIQALKEGRACHPKEQHARMDEEPRKRRRHGLLDSFPLDALVGGWGGPGTNARDVDARSPQISRMQRVDEFGLPVALPGAERDQARPILSYEILGRAWRADSRWRRIFRVSPAVRSEIRDESKRMEGRRGEA